MWASSNLSADAFFLVYDITSLDSLDALDYFNDLIDMEAETRLDNAARARRAGLGAGGSARRGSIGLGGAGSGARTIPPVKIPSDLAIPAITGAPPVPVPPPIPACMYNTHIQTLTKHT